MIPVDRIAIGPEDSLRLAMERMSAARAGLVLIVDAGRFVGVLSDGDVRRALLNGAGLDSRASAVANQSPATVSVGAPHSEVVAVARRTGATWIPVLGALKEAVGIVSSLEDEPTPTRAHVLLMAGGKGTRLMPLTRDRPKPLMPVAGRPILERTIERLAIAGFSDVTIAVNHMADRVIDHFQSVGNFGINLEFVRESEPLGTAGAVSLLSVRDCPVIVMNADLLTKVDLRRAVEWHVSERVDATVCVQMYEIGVPYGVLKLDALRVIGIDEKPTLRFPIAAGITVLSPQSCDLVSPGERIDMPDLLERVRTRLSGGVSAFVLDEYWMDVGRVEDYERAQVDFAREFET